MISVAALVVALAAHASAGGEILCLKDGRIVEGKPIARADGGFEVSFEKGKVFVPEALVLDCVLEEDAGYEPKTQEERDQLAKGLVPYEGKWLLPKKRDELVSRKLAERRKALDEIRAHSEWRDRRFEKTRNFAFEHTLPLNVFEHYRDMMEAYFVEFTKLWRIKPPKDPLTVCLYIDPDSFHQTAGAGSGTLGYFRFVEPIEANFFYERLDPAATEWVMLHETNHYLQKLLAYDFGYPHFPGESLAEYWGGGSQWDPKTKKLSIGHVLEGRLCEIQNDLAAGEKMGLERLISTDRMYAHYTWGWSLVHFLMNDPALSKKFQKFYLELPTAKDVRRVPLGYGKLQTVESAEVWSAFQRYLGLETSDDVKALESAWHAYVQENLKLVTPRGLALGAARALQTGRPIKAKRLFKEALEKGCTEPLAFHRYAKLLAAGDDDEEAFGMWKKALELDPLNADFYHSYGLALKRKGKKEEGERLVALAIEIDPDTRWWDDEIDISGDEDDD